ncbi:DUF2742 domain-containing protein [Gordonia amarae]|uniref:Uncharacterized protein n=2 Tax=Gordonia amarae TaxID=36821 RepID=G7GWA6_9ACTN|nr:DUF2742 domain-containing protein [Gordonia amarae]MCS3880971.1 hypothetical protein [Gordonia amarae]QHN19212.1 DUF2742 domain-containing protein [Gordonia amarae]QHN23688.1 DUF2742 domain-containing protein [Gordonia amarae]QHN32600.1 DUF2742 domain-containing protein [Gordonia amarae]QHN41348.1 DUF2742 domain-containing protein [Gordonia amarae]
MPHTSPEQPPTDRPHLDYESANRLRYQLTQAAVLPDDIDRADFIELLTAGVRDIYHRDLDDYRHAHKAAAVAVSQAADWTAVAKRVRDRDQALKSGAYIPRRTA